MRSMQKQISQLNTDLKLCMDDCKEIYTKHVERLQRERDTALLAASQIDDPNNINAQLPPGVEISNKKVRLVTKLLRNEVWLKLLFLLPVCELQSWRDGGMLALSTDALLLNLLSAQRLDHPSERVHQE